MGSEHGDDLRTSGIDEEKSSGHGNLDDGEGLNGEIWVVALVKIGQRPLIWVRRFRRSEKYHVESWG